MATLKEAIIYAKQNPTDPKSEKLKSAIIMGKMDAVAEAEGIDLSAFKSKVAPMASKVMPMITKAASTVKELAKAPQTWSEKITANQLKSIGMPEEEISKKVLQKRIEGGEPSMGVAERVKEGFVEGLKGSEEKIQRRVEGRMEEEKQMEGLTGMDKVFAKLSNLGKEIGTGVSVVTEPFIKAAEEVISPIVQPAIEGAGKATMTVWEALYGKDVAEETKRQALGKITNLMQTYEDLPDDQKEVIDNTLRFADIATLFTGGKAAKEVGSEVGEQALKAGVKGVELAKPIVAKGVEAVGEATEAISKFIAKTPEQIKKQADEIVGTIAQGKAKDIPKIKSALSMADTTGVKTYDDLAQVASSNIEGLSSKLDEFLDTQAGVYKLDDLSTSVKVGEKTVSQNFVKKALDHLKELYVKTDDLEALAKIQQLSIKASKEGLTLKEVNQIAKEYGSTFGQKAFSKLGEPLTSVNSVAYENIRKGIKNTFRSKIDNDIAKTIDLQISDFYKLQSASRKMAEKVNALAQKVQKRNLMQRIARKAADVVDVATFGVPKSFISRLFIPSNVGNKVMNSLDLQEQLVKNLKQLDRLLKASDDEVVEALSKGVKPTPKPFNSAGEPGTPLTSGSKTATMKGVKLYHGTIEGGFDKLKAGSGGNQGAGIYLTDNPTIAKYHSLTAEDFKFNKTQGRMPFQADRKVGSVMDIEINPNAKIKSLDHMPTKAEVDTLKKQGFDGVKFPDQIAREDWSTKLLGEYPKDTKANTTMIFNEDMVNVKAKGGNLLTQDPLLQEAKKYKSAEEFVNKETNYFYGGGSEIKKIDGRKISKGGELGDGFYFTGNEDKAKLYGGTITNLKVELENPLIITKDELWKKGGLMDKYNQNPKYNQELAKQGYDGVLVKEGNKIDQGIVFNPSQIKTKSQLTDIWNKANKKGATPPPKGYKSWADYYKEYPY